MPLNQVQIDFVNEAARPHLETFIRAVHELDTFVADYDALQGTADSIPEDATVLDDGDGGTAPRADAPTLTGADLKNLRDFSANASAVLTAPANAALIARMVRPLAVVLRLL